MVLVVAELWYVDALEGGVVFVLFREEVCPRFLSLEVEVATRDGWGKVVV